MRKNKKCERKMRSHLNTFSEYNNLRAESADFGAKFTHKMREQRVADCGGNFVPNKKASPQFTLV